MHVSAENQNYIWESGIQTVEPPRKDEYMCLLVDCYISMKDS